MLSWFVLPLRYSTNGAARRAAAYGRLCRSGSTNYDNANLMNGRFLFYHENKAIQCDKWSDNKPSWWNVPVWQRHWNGSVHRNSVRNIGQYDVTIASGSCIDGVTITHLFSVENVSGASRNERHDFRLFRVTWRFKMQMNRGISQ